MASALGVSSGNYIDDETLYYQPAVLQIREKWPALDVVKDSLSATSPGYPWILAGASLLVGPSLGVLRILNLAIGLFTLFVLGRTLCRKLGSLEAALLLLPVATSNYFLKSCCWLVTDNASLLLVVCAFCALLSDLGRSKPLILGLLLGAAVFVRQSNLWLVAPVAISVFFRLDCQDTSTPRIASRLLRVAIAVVPAALIFVWLLQSWGGLVPPRWLERAQHFSLAPVVYLIALQGLLSMPFIAAIELSRPNRDARWLPMLFGASIGLILAIVGETYADYASGRWGGILWNVADATPVFAGRSVFLTMMAALGGATIGWFAGELQFVENRRHFLIVALALFAFGLSFIPNRQAFHRYFEPTLLVLISLACMQIFRGGLRLSNRASAVLIVFGLVCLGVSALLIFGANVTYGMRPPGFTGR
ncbi:hypothetical protein AYO41_04035 [Verrucomicrobia bacterium SCGC AG-212-E04]|nr:hypothetical protein AYO41_04035 [Verrucomicrobia bacterium SCGC AG-212-E04]